MYALVAMDSVPVRSAPRATDLRVVGLLFSGAIFTSCAAIFARSLASSFAISASLSPRCSSGCDRTTRARCESYAGQYCRSSLS